MREKLRLGLASRLGGTTRVYKFGFANELSIGGCEFSLFFTGNVEKHLCILDRQHRVAQHHQHVAEAVVRGQIAQANAEFRQRLVIGYHRPPQAVERIRSIVVRLPLHGGMRFGRCAHDEWPLAVPTACAEHIAVRRRAILEVFEQ